MERRPTIGQTIRTKYEGTDNSRITLVDTALNTQTAITSVTADGLFSIPGNWNYLDWFLDTVIPQGTETAFYLIITKDGTTFNSNLSPSVEME